MIVEAASAGQPFATTFVGQYLQPAIVAILAVGVPSMMGALWKLLRQGGKAVVAANEAKAAVVLVEERMNNRMDSQDEVLKELKPNGGGSLKDVAKATQAAVGVLTSNQAEIKEKLQAHLIASASESMAVKKDIEHLQQQARQ